MKITWIGHSCFRIENDGYVVVTDPYAPGSVPGLKDVKESAQLVCCSHGHADHACKEGVEIVKSDGEAPIIQKIDSWHDEVKGAKRGENTIYIFNFNAMKVVHMGDIGCDLNEQEIELLKDTDILMIPVGGFYTIDWKQAMDMVKDINPRIVIPMHYRDDSLHFGYDVIGTLDEFLHAFGENVLMEGSCIDTDDFSTEDSMKIIRMIPQNAVQEEM